MEIRCKYSRLIYRADNGGFTVALYKSPAPIKLPDGRELTSFKAVSNSLLPLTPQVEYVLEGKWELAKTKTGGYEYQFTTESFNEPKPNTKEGVIKYLSTLSGVGKVTARRIYDAFGTVTLDVLDNNPERLLEVKGIRKKSLEKIQASLIERGAGKELFVYLYSFGITATRIYQIYNRYKGYALDTAQNKPYDLIEVAGIGFNTADRIARGNNLPPDNTERIKAAISEVLLQSENGGQLFRKCPSGNTYLEWQNLCDKTFELLGLTIPYDKMAAICLEMVRENSLYIGSKKYFYRYTSYLSEYGIAKQIIRLLDATFPDTDYSKEIAEAEKKANVKLADHQRQAVQACLTSPITIITGGPGTGKTMIEKVLLDVYVKIHPGKSVLLCSPTGRAARRMSESTGRPASTIHQALGLYAADSENASFASFEKPQVSQDLILVDEVSMLDSYLANTLLSAIKHGAQVVLIGDANQLPSVGPGCVLRELIACEKIPVVKLTKIFRQKNGSSIAINAARINNGITLMEYDEDFKLIETSSQEETLETVKVVYEEQVAKYGVDDVTVLSPFRQKTITGVDALNPVLREVINPTGNSKPKITCGKITYYEGDKVMQTRNNGMLANGDIGYINRISDGDDGLSMLIDFGFVDMDYYPEDATVLDLAYATTVHKAQGSEYRSVIFICRPEHVILLKRNLIYTAISRSVENVIIIGDNNTFTKGILIEDTKRRNSRLSDIILQMYKETYPTKKTSGEKQLSYLTSQ